MPRPKHTAAVFGLVSVYFEGWPDLKSGSDGLAPSLRDGVSRKLEEEK